MKFTAQEQADLTAHEEILTALLRTADDFLPQHPEQELCARQATLLEQLEAAFAGNQTLEYAKRHGIPYGGELQDTPLSTGTWRIPAYTEGIPQLFPLK